MVGSLIDGSGSGMIDVGECLAKYGFGISTVFKDYEL